MKTIAIAALLISTTQTPASAPMQPSGKWTVDYRDASCVLSHDYGAGDDLMTVGLSPSPLGVDIDIMTLTPGAPKVRYRRVQGKLILQPSGRSIDR